MFGRSILHSIHNAPVYNQRWQVSFTKVSHEIRKEQIKAKSNFKNYIRMAAVDSHESTS